MRNPSPASSHLPVKSWLTIACVGLLNRKDVDNPLAARDHGRHLMGHFQIRQLKQVINR
jgi:hypothetical protein